MKNLKSFVLVAFVALISNIVSAQVEPVDKNKLAIGGYDVVSYFTPGKATKGEEKFAVEYKGANYYFSSAKNQNTFKANPEKYIPQCDGYCAWGIAADKGNFPINPLTYKVVDGKLYLFFNGLHEGKQFDSLNEWNKDENDYIKKLAAAPKKANKK